MKNPNFFFFGSDEFAVKTLEVLAEANVLPSHIITTPEVARGRGLIESPSPVAVWAENKGISFFEFKKLSDNQEALVKAGASKADFFLVAYYKNFVPKEIFELPHRGSLNIHPSLLPRLRGASPITTAIREEKETGVTIIRISNEMDAGPIIAQEKVRINPWPAKQEVVEQTLVEAGARLFLKTLPNWMGELIKETPQDDSKATYTKKTEKEDGLINMPGSPDENYKIFLAYHRKPGVFFFVTRQGKRTRVIIKDALFKNGTFVPTRVVPEGKKEMDYEAFLRGFKEDL